MTDLNAALRAAILKALPLQRGPVVEELHTVHGHGVIHEWVPQHEIADAILAAIQPVLDEGVSVEWAARCIKPNCGGRQGGRQGVYEISTDRSAAETLIAQDDMPYELVTRRQFVGEWEAVPNGET